MEESTEIRRYIIPFCVVIIALHAWAALEPSHYNWGFHQFAFYPLWAGSIALVVCGAYLFSRPRSIALEGLTRLVQKTAALPTPVLFLILAVLLVVVALLLRAKGLLLGDSWFLSQLTPENPAVADRSANFRHQPLTYLLIRGIRYLLGGGEAVSVSRTYQAVGIVAGLCFLAVLFAFLKNIPATMLERALIGGIFTFRVATEFFLGYVENYAFLYVGMTAYLLAGWLVLAGKAHWSVPVILFVVDVGLHIGSLVFLPSLVVILVATRGWKVLTATLGATGVAGGLILAVSGGGPGFGSLSQRIADAARYDVLSLDAASSSAGAYAMFSRAHLVDWGNAFIMNAPFAVIGIIFIVVFWQRLRGHQRLLLLFLVTAGACGLLFTFVFNPGLGMARDWDILAVFFLPLGVLTVFGLLEVLKGRPLRHALMLILVLRLFRSGAWFGINASEEEHLARAEMLTVPELSGPIRKYYYEAVADRYWKQTDYAKAAHWYELYWTVDSLNPRIAANLSSCYDNAGDPVRAEAMLRRAAALGTTIPGVYSNLGLKLIQRGKIDSAITVLRIAVRLDPSLPEPHANLVTGYLRKDSLERAAEEALTAFRCGLNDPGLLKVAALAYARLGNDELALRYLDLYVPRAPHDLRSRQFRDELKARMRR